MHTEKVVDYIVKWLKDYATNAGVNGFVIGISGGIDSAVTSTLCAKTGLHLMCIEMPIHQAPSQVSRAMNHIDWLKSNFNKVEMTQVNLTPVFDNLIKSLPSVDNEEERFMSLANTRAIADLLKTEVYTIAEFLGINKEIIEAAPTDGLWGDDRTDEDQIGASYPELEWAMKMDDDGKTIADFSDRELVVFKIYKRYNNANKHKMIPIPICEIPSHLK